MKSYGKGFTNLANNYFCDIYSTLSDIITAEIGKQHTSDHVVNAELEVFNHDMQNAINLTENVYIDKPYKVDEKQL